MYIRTYIHTSHHKLKFMSLHTYMAFDGSSSWKGSSAHGDGEGLLPIGLSGWSPRQRPCKRCKWERTVTSDAVNQQGCVGTYAGWTHRHASSKSEFCSFQCQRNTKRQQSVMSVNIFHIGTAYSSALDSIHTYLCPLSTATSRQLSFVRLSMAVTSAPFSISTSAAARWPLRQARKSGVFCRHTGETLWLHKERCIIWLST